ncbi:MAG: hypothetical protein CMI13_04765 [Oleibacter sp.]|nr:hypothetical protein [Thalassolituus sp.]
MMKLRSQQGMTLIELMIAGVLGLIVAYFIMTIMMNSNRTSMISSGTAQAQENGRFVMSWLQEEVRRAGYTPIVGSDKIAPFAPVCGGATPQANCTYESDAGWNDNDNLAIQWRFSPESTLARDRQDCTGVAITLTAEAILTDVYWLETGNADSGYDDVLRCATFLDTGAQLNAAQTIASGVIGMQVLYGESMTETADGTTNVTRYIDAGDVTDWTRVQAVRIAILTRSFADQTLQQADRSYILMNASPYNFSDSVARYMQISTVALPNMN